MNKVIRPRVSMGILLFIMVMAVMVFTAAPLQFAWKMWGLALTELILLAMAIIPVLILRWDFREVFRMRIPTWRQVFGTLVLWLGSYIAVLTVVMIISYLFPQGMSDVGSDMLEFFASVPFPVRFFILTVMPAICEEALHRGFILYSFKHTSKWTAIISMGFIFGLFHLDPYRFLGTAILGAVLTYIMIETRNILLPMLFHFVNNAPSALVTLISTPGAEAGPTPLASVGLIVLMATATPFLLLAGSRLLLSKEERKSRPITKATWIVAIVMAAVLAISGAVMTVAGAIELMADLMAPPAFETAFSQDVNRDTPGHQLEFSVEEAGRYQLDLNIQGAEGVVTEVVITGGTGQEVYRASAGEMTGQGYVDLAAGDYLVTVTFSTESQEYLPVRVEIQISHWE